MQLILVTDPYPVCWFQALDACAVQIVLTPGFVCRKGFADHEEQYVQRENKLIDIATDIHLGVQEAEPLFTARDSLREAERRLRQRELLQIALRTAVSAALHRFFHLCLVMC